MPSMLWRKGVGCSHVRSQWGVGETNDVKKFSNFGPEGFQNFEISLN